MLAKKFAKPKKEKVMKAKVFLPMAVLVFCAAGAAAQYPSAPQPVMVSPDAIAMIANELSNIAKNVQTMNERLKAVTDKGNAAAPALTDPRQKIILGIQALAGAEQRVFQLQAAQYDLTQRLNDTRGKLSQTELDLRPQRIDRVAAFEGTTDTEEFRENRRQKLQSDKTNLTALLQQTQVDLQNNGDLLRDAQRFANDLRRQYIPAMNREMTEQ